MSAKLPFLHIKPKDCSTLLLLNHLPFLCLKAIKTKHKFKNKKNNKLIQDWAMIPLALEWPQVWHSSKCVCTLLNSEPSYAAWKDSLVKLQVTARRDSRQEHRPALSARNLSWFRWRKRIPGAGSALTAPESPSAIGHRPYKEFLVRGRQTMAELMIRIKKKKLQNTPKHAQAFPE